jgi:hypothetical protein
MEESKEFKYQIFNNIIITSNQQRIAHNVNMFIQNFLNYNINIDFLMLGNSDDDILCPMLHICRAIFYSSEHSFEMNELYLESCRKANENTEILRDKYNIDIELNESLWVSILDSARTYNHLATCKLFLKLSFHFPNDLFAFRIGMVKGLTLGKKNFLVELMENFSKYEKNEDSIYFIGIKAFILCETKKFSECEVLLSKGYKIDSKNVWIHHVYSHLFFSISKIRESIEFLENCRRDWVEGNSFIYKHINWHLAISYMDSGQFEKCNEIMDQIVSFPFIHVECLLNVYGYMIRMLVRNNFSFYRPSYIDKLINYGLEDRKLMSNPLYDMMLFWFISFIFNIILYSNELQIDEMQWIDIIDKIKMKLNVQNEEEIFNKYFSRIKQNTEIIIDEKYKRFIRDNYIPLLEAMVKFGKKQFSEFISIYKSNEQNLSKLGASDEQREVIVEIAIFCSEACDKIDYTNELILRYYGANNESMFLKQYKSD